MNIYTVVKTLTLTAGLLLLTAKQAQPRRHVLVAQPVRFKAFKVKKSDIELMGVEKSDELGIYEVTGTTQFKVGEVIGYVGDANKQLLQFIAPAGEKAEQEKQASDNGGKSEVDTGVLYAEIRQAIAKLDKNNPEHYAGDKPLRAAVINVLGKKIKAADLDAAFAGFVPAPVNPAVPGIAEDVLAALKQLDAENDSNYEADGETPKLSVIAGIVGREVSAEELAAAIDYLNAQDAAAGQD